MSASNDFEKYKNHMAITSCSDLAEIMMPELKPHGITTFNFYKNYFDGSTVRLSTNREWTEHYFKKNYHNSSTVPSAYLTKSLNYYIWLIDDCPAMLVDAAKNFNMANGISIAIRCPDAIEFYCFAAEASNTSIVNFYLNHLELLYSYSQNFKEKASDLLQKSEKNKIITPDMIKKGNELKHIIRNAPELYLSKQQLICAQLLLKGKRIKEIAKDMNLSDRTVEFYIKNIKSKLACKNTTELIIKLAQFV